MNWARRLLAVAMALSAQFSSFDARAAAEEGSAKASRADHVRFGALGGAGFPYVLSVGGFVKIERRLAIGATYGVFPKMRLSTADTSFHALSAEAMFFPFAGGFFVGASGGRQSLRATSAAGLEGDATGVTWFVSPRIGYLSTARSGWTFGIDAGVQIPVEARLSSTLPSEGAEGVVSTATFVTRGVLPTIDLLRVGLLL